MLIVSFSAKGKVDMRKKDMTPEEKLLSEMTVLERQIMGRAGQWKIRNGKYWDEGLSAYVMRCKCCKHLFLAKRSDKKTCSEKCKKEQQRKSGVGVTKPREEGKAQLTFADLDKLLKRHQRELAAVV